MNERGQYGNGSRRWQGRATAVGDTVVYHSVGDREKALAQLSSDYEQLYGELSAQILGATPDHPYGTQAAANAHPPWFVFWQTVAVPIFNGWRHFKAERTGENWTHGGSYIAYGEQFKTDWSEYEKWFSSLASLRSGARSLGITLHSPEPKELDKTVLAEASQLVKDVGTKALSGVGDIWTFVKYGAWAVLGIGTIVALSSVASNMRSGRDPAENYLQIAKSRSRDAALVEGV